MQFRRSFSAWALALAFPVIAFAADDNTAPQTAKDKTSYVIGVQTARNLKKDATDYDLQWIIKGLQDATAGRQPLLSETEIKSTMQQLMTEVRQKMVANKREASGRNARRGLEFMGDNQRKSGVAVLPNGVQYEVLKAGEGRKPSEADTVIISYRGTLLDGTQFDGTAPGQPATMSMRQLIPGMREALKQMPAGSRWSLVVPPTQAYGEKGVGSDIGPNETLLFEVELLEIK